MKKDIHPQYNKNITVSCACGASFITGSTASELKTEICSTCHPFYTGKQKLIDTARRVEKFQARSQAKAAIVRNKKTKHANRISKKIESKK